MVHPNAFFIVQISLLRPPFLARIVGIVSRISHYPVNQDKVDYALSMPRLSNKHMNKNVLSCIGIIVSGMVTQQGHFTAAAADNIIISRYFCGI